jgi:predicted secreted protein
MTDIEVQPTDRLVKAGPGDRIVVRLPETATTGYQWAVEEVEGPLEVELTELVPPNDARPGAGGERLIVLRGRGTGAARVIFAQRRPWESEPIERRELAVTIG